MLPEDQQLERQIDRELKALPPLNAPVTLIARVLAAIAAQARLPWYHRAWQTWPANLRWTSLATLLALFGGLTYGGWSLSNAAVARFGETAAEKFSVLTAISRALEALVNAIYVFVRDLGPGTLAGICAAALLGYAMLLALGAVYVRLALGGSKLFNYENA